MTALFGSYGPTAIAQGDAKEIADRLDIDHYRGFSAQLGHWVKGGLLSEAGRGLHELTAEWRSPATITGLPPRPTA